MSHSSGSGLLAPGYKVEEHNFKGATRFVYYRNHQPCYVFSDTDLSKRPEIELKSFLILLFFIPFFALCYYLWSLAIEKPVPPLTNTSSYKCIIQDDANVLTESEEVQLQAVLDQFMESTGVPVAFYTDFNSSWTGYFDSIEDYANQLYYRNFIDECHWVIVYTQSQENDADHPSWYCGDVNGTEADNILGVIYNFDQNMQESLKETKAVSTVFEDVFSYCTQRFNSQKTRIIKSEVAKPIVVSVFIGIQFIVVMFFILKGNKKYKNSELIKVGDGSDLPKTEICKNCSGVYVKDIHDKCPHCGVKIEHRETKYVQNTLF